MIVSLILFLKEMKIRIPGLGGPLGSPDQGTVCTGGANLMSKAWDQPCRGDKLVAVKGFQHGLDGGALLWQK